MTFTLGSGARTAGYQLAAFDQIGSTNAEAMSRADKIYITRVHTVIEGDTDFPVIQESQWQLISNLDFPADAKHAYAYSFQLWQRKKS